MDVMTAKTMSVETDADFLIRMAAIVKFPRGRLCLIDSLPAGADSLIKTALDFDRQSAGFRLRALMEDWNLRRINEEMY